jgi:hypothetical protein
MGRVDLKGGAHPDEDGLVGCHVPAIRETQLLSWDEQTTSNCCTCSGQRHHYYLTMALTILATSCSLTAPGTHLQTNSSYESFAASSTATAPKMGPPLPPWAVGQHELGHGAACERPSTAAVASAQRGEVSKRLWSVSLCAYTRSDGSSIRLDPRQLFVLINLQIDWLNFHAEETFAALCAIICV